MAGRLPNGGPSLRHRVPKAPGVGAMAAGHDVFDCSPWPVGRAGSALGLALAFAFYTHQVAKRYRLDGDKTEAERFLAFLTPDCFAIKSRLEQGQ